MRIIDADALKYKNLAEVNGRLTYVLTAEEIDNTPTVYPICSYDCKYATVYKRTKGEWIYKRVDTQRCGNIHGCNICGQEVESFSTDYQNRPCAFNFCPNCGADMRGK